MIDLDGYQGESIHEVSSFSWCFFSYWMGWNLKHGWGPEDHKRDTLYCLHDMTWKTPKLFVQPITLLSRVWNAIPLGYRPWVPWAKASYKMTQVRDWSVFFFFFLKWNGTPLGNLGQGTPRNTGGEGERACEQWIALVVKRMILQKEFKKSKSWQGSRNRLSRRTSISGEKKKRSTMACFSGISQICSEWG